MCACCISIVFAPIILSYPLPLPTEPLLSNKLPSYSHAFLWLWLPTWMCVGGRLPEHDLHGDSPADESRVPLKLSFEAPEKCPFWGPTALNLDRESFSSDFLSLLLLIFFLFRDKKWLQIQRPISPFSVNSFIVLVLKFWSLKGIYR